MRGEYRKRGNLYEYCFDGEVQYSCEKIAVAVDMGDCIVLRHGSASDVREWVEKERTKLVESGKRSRADNLVAAVLPESMGAPDVNGIIRDPRRLFHR